MVIRGSGNWSQKRIKEHKLKIFYLFIAVLLLAGCSGANVTSQIRESGEQGSSKMLRCVSISTSSDDSVNQELKKYDGWKMVYVSEYTTSNKANTAAVVCFEKPF